jgi:hypothetical protein
MKHWISKGLNKLMNQRGQQRIYKRQYLLEGLRLLKAINTKKK